MVLIAGERATSFAADIVNVFLNVTNRGAIETIFLNGQKKRHELDKEIVRLLSKESKTVILDGKDYRLDILSCKCWGEGRRIIGSNI